MQVKITAVDLPTVGAGIQDHIRRFCAQGNIYIPYLALDAEPWVRVWRGIRGTRYEARV